MRGLYAWSWSAGANERAAFRNPGREYPGSSHLHDVSLSVVASTCVSIRMSLIMFAREHVSGSLGISPHGLEQCNLKGRGPDCISAVLTDTSVIDHEPHNLLVPF